MAWRPPATVWFVAGASLASLIHYFTSVRPTSQTISSPLSLLPQLSDAERQRLPYPPDSVLPGARDVDTPYGSIRVYEWGPKDGRKVVFVHGISTPALSLGALASSLVAERGCRVLLFDLFGRGYSDAPTGADYDIRLYTSQILLVLSSSELAWKRFSIVGYSLGGGISTLFTSYFPNMIEDLILIAPGGLVRPQHFGWRSKLMYSTRLFPEWLLERVVKGRLSSGNSKDPETSAVEDDLETEVQNADDAVNAEIPASDVERRIERPGATFNNASLSKSRSGVNIASVVSWQLENHRGFIPAFMSSIRYAPIHTQQHHWRRIGERIAAQNGSASGGSSPSQSQYQQNLGRSKVLLIVGADDPIILKDEIIADATEALSPGKLHVNVVDAGHELPITRSKEVSEAICDLWDLG